MKTQKPLGRPGFNSSMIGDVGSRVSSSLSTDLRQNTAPAAVRRAFVAAANVVVSNLGQINFLSHCILGVVVLSRRHLAAMFALLREYAAG